MEIGIEYERKTVAGERLRAEAVIPRLDGEGRGIERINAFYRTAAEVFLARAAALRLPEGRYTAQLCAAAERKDAVLTVQLCWRLCRRGRGLEEKRCLHRWLLPQGYLQPDTANPSRKRGKV